MHEIKHFQPSSDLHRACGDDTGYKVKVHLTVNRAAVHVRKPLAGLLLADDPALVLISVEPCIVLMQSALTPAECKVLAQSKSQLVCMPLGFVSRQRANLLSDVAPKRSLMIWSY